MISFPAAKKYARLYQLSAPKPRVRVTLTEFLCPFLPKVRQSSSDSLKQDTSERIEEETFNYYSPDCYYPVRFGEILHSRYEVVSKLGYGASSTVWLCRDIKKRKTHHVVVKVGTCNSSQADQEIKVSEYLGTIRSKHPGAALVRRLVNHFEIRGSSGQHSCLVYPVLGTPVDVIREMLPNRKLSEALLKALVAQTLYALDFLHSEAEIIYTDLKADNLIFSIGDTSHLIEYVDAARKHSTPDKIDGERFIYRSRDLIALRELGPPVLCDFGEARLKTDPHSGFIMPYQYRAPEVLLGVPWDTKIDIWSVAMLTWHLLEDSPMFVPLDEHYEPSTLVHLAQMIRLLGAPPSELLQRSDASSEYFDDDGQLLADIDVPATSLQDAGEALAEPNRQLFLDLGELRDGFLRKGLQRKNS